MIGYGYQAKSFTYHVIDQLFGRPGTITVYGMHLQVDGSIRSQHEMRSQCFHNLLLPECSHLHSTAFEAPGACALAYSQAAAKPGNERSIISSLAVKEMRKYPGNSTQVPGRTRMSWVSSRSAKARSSAQGDFGRR